MNGRLTKTILQMRQLGRRLEKTSLDSKEDIV